jgi:hypothetical protein
MQCVAGPTSRDQPKVLTVHLDDERRGTALHRWIGSREDDPGILPRLWGSKSLPLHGPVRCAEHQQQHQPLRVMATDGEQPDDTATKE